MSSTSTTRPDAGPTGEMNAAVARSLGEPDSSAVLHAVDEMMSEAVAGAAPIRFDIARTDAERDAVFRLRYRVATERGWANPAEFPTGLERDPFDREAVHIVGWDKEALVATSRLVCPKKDRPLPTEAAFDLAVEPLGRVVNIDRLIVAPGYSDRRHRAMVALLGATWTQTRAHGFHAWVGISTPAMVRLFRLLGFATLPLAPPQRYWNEVRVPILCDGARGATEALKRRAKALAGLQRSREHDDHAEGN